MSAIQRHTDLVRNEARHWSLRVILRLERAAGIFLPSRSTRNYPQRAFKDGWTFAIAWDSLRPGRLHTC